MDDVLLWVLVFLGGFVGGISGKAVSGLLYRRREKQFLRYVRALLPNGKVVEAISVSSTDKQAIANVERRLRDASKTL